jgi:hypothetical protein
MKILIFTRHERFSSRAAGNDANPNYDRHWKEKEIDSGSLSKYLGLWA